MIHSKQSGVGIEKHYTYLFLGHHLKREIISIIIMCILTSYGHLVIKHSSSSIVLTRNIPLLFRQFLRPGLISGLAAVLCAPFFYFYALKSLELNTAYSFTALNQIIIPGLGIVIFRERITLKKAAAVLLIASGILIWNL